MAPLFLFRAIKNYRNREYRLQAIIICATACLQAYLVLSAMQDSTHIQDGRLRSFDISMYGFIIWIRAFIVPIFGLKASHSYISSAIQNHYSGLILLAIQCSLFFWFFRAVQKKYVIPMLYSYFAVLTIFIIGSTGEKSTLLGPNGGERYFLFSNTVLLLMLLASTSRFPYTFNKAVVSILLGIALWSGVKSYREIHRYKPNWFHEVMKWKKDPNYHMLKIWPDGWYSNLKGYKLKK